MRLTDNRIKCSQFSRPTTIQFEKEVQHGGADSSALVTNEEFTESERSDLSGLALDVVETAQIETEWHRVLHALTIPEYLEAWLKQPQGVRISLLPQATSLKDAGATIFFEHAPQRWRKPVPLLFKSHKVLYLWESMRAGRIEKSIVEFRLRGGPRQSTLKLRHQWFVDHDERDRHRRIWRLSLARLCKLMS